MKLFTREDCIRSMYAEAPNDSNEGCVGILKLSHLEIFSPEYQKSEFQLFRILGGFGASPSKMGNAVFGHFCADGEECRQEKYNFIGIANEEVTRYAEELEKKWQR